MNELVQNAEAHWDLIMKSPLPETQEEIDQENETLGRVSDILGV